MIIICLPYMNIEHNMNKWIWIVKIDSIIKSI